MQQRACRTSTAAACWSRWVSCSSANPPPTDGSGLTQHLLAAGDVAALKRVLPKPKRQLGDAALQKLQQQAAEEGSNVARLLLGCCPALEMQLFPRSGPLDLAFRDWRSAQRQLQAGLVGGAAAGGLLCLLLPGKIAQVAVLAVCPACVTAFYCGVFDPWETLSGSSVCVSVLWNLLGSMPKLLCCANPTSHACCPADWLPGSRAP
jgi:hypothetical protein